MCLLILSLTGPYETCHASNARMDLLKKGLINTFRVDIWDEVLEECDGDAKEFYKTYKKKLNILTNE